VAINARYIHSAFGLRYLFANLGELQNRSKIYEWTIKDHPLVIVEQLLATDPKIVGIGVYIWNVDVATAVVSLLKKLRPELIVVLGGPEVSHEWEGQRIVDLADYVVLGEADLSFAELCNKILAGHHPSEKIQHTPRPDVNLLRFPYEYYDEQDIANRVIYVEASRGCPFRCEFCLSSLDHSVRQWDLKNFLHQMDQLYIRGVRQFKFVDRSFNLDINVSIEILDFFACYNCPDLFLHFEIIPDHFPPNLREAVQRFAPSSLQFEVGIQTFNPEASARIQRRQNRDQMEETLRFLREEKHVHLHADLIFGLPGEDLESFALGFDHLLALRPQEIQVGMLKRLRGTSISRHTTQWGLIFLPHPPYEILQTNQIEFAQMQQLRRFAQLWDRYANSGNFLETLPLLWLDRSPFWSFWEFSDWVYQQLGQTHSISLPNLMEQIFRFLTEYRQIEPQQAALALWQDSPQKLHGKLPRSLQSLLEGHLPTDTSYHPTQVPPRQAKHREHQSQR
jgi:radical SAM superfamily enzyme YgiQ (UPF0313 family)